MFYYKDQPILGQRGPSGPDGNPLGTVISFMGLTAPDGYLACDGAVYNIADYTELAFFFRAQFGAENYFGGDGVTTFAVPDLRNLFLRGYHGEAEEQVSGEIGQRQEGTTAAIPRIFGNGIIGFPIDGPAVKDADKEISLTGYRGYTNSGTDTKSPNVLSYISRPMNIAVLYCIKALPSDPVLEEYDTDDSWHVRKWSDGYLEMSYRQTVDIAVNNAFGNVGFYRNTGIDTPYPVIPTTVYSSNAGLIEVSTGALVGIYRSKTEENVLKGIYLFSADKNVQTYTIGVYITGRWK